MKYTVYSIIPMGVLSSSGARSVDAVNTDDFYRFFVSSDGDLWPNLTPSVCFFDKSSNMRLVRAKIDILGAQGLRPAKVNNFIIGGTHCARVLYGVNRVGSGYEKFFSSFMASFGLWYPVDIVVDCNSLSQNFMRLDPSHIEIAYDAYKIKSDYQGQPFSICIELEIECSGKLGG